MFIYANGFRVGDHQSNFVKQLPEKTTAAVTTARSWGAQGIQAASKLDETHNISGQAQQAFGTVSATLGGWWGRARGSLSEQGGSGGTDASAQQRLTDHSGK